jgi:uncharacterized protein
MSTELRPLGVACNLSCLYCYQNPQRDAGNVRAHYDLDRMKAAVKAEGGPFTLFGGEPLLLPLDDLENLWAWGLAEFERNSLQTNGTLVTEQHIELFKRYKVHVGISIDGPGPLNDLRWYGSVDRTREATQKSEAAIARLCQAGLTPSIIITLHRLNAIADALPVLLDWVSGLDRLGLRHSRLFPTYRS